MLKRLDKWVWLAIILMLLGTILRLAHLLIVPMNEPFRLGGLFYEFSRQIALNGFAFPEVIPYYSAGGIPFAYPPLSFYVQAILLKIFNPPLFWTVNLLPPLVTLLSLPAFYWMLRQYTEDTQLVLGGLFAFALMPAAFTNQIEAAGLAESFGIVALILYLGLLIRWKKAPNLKDTLLAGILLGICVLSSPGSAYGATLFSVVFFIAISLRGIKQHDLKPAGLLILVGTLGMAVSAPYWLGVNRNHGFDFFLTAFAGQHGTVTLVPQIEKIIGFQPGGEYLGFIWNWLILAGLIWTILKHQNLMVGMFLVFWVIPREGVWLVAIPAAVLAGMGLIYVFLPLIRKAFQKGNQLRPPLAPGILITVFSILLFANLVFTLGVYISDPEWYLGRDQIDALAQFQADIPENRRVITVGNIGLAEWAPALLQREVLNIEYGLEWQPDELIQVQAINAALEESDLAALVEAISAYTDDDQIYLIASAEAFSNFQDQSSEGISLTPVKTTSTLTLSILHIR